MDGINGTLARISAIQNQLSTLRQPTDGGFESLLRAVTAPTGVPSAGVRPTTRASAAWAAAERPSALVNPAVEPAPARNEISSAPTNGRLPESGLVSIGGGDRLQPAGAAGFEAMRAQAARDGVNLRVNDSYRSIAEQEDIAARKGLYSQGGLAAKPGTSSHGLGLSVDLQLDAPAQSWMRANAGRFGFEENVAREPWHWTFTETDPTVP